MYVSDAQIVATGTAFLVRSAPPSQALSDAFGVTLIEGQVIVQRSTGATWSAFDRPVVMAPGERLRVSPSPSKPYQAQARTQVDRPRLDQLLAWKRGFAMFDDVTLPEAIADMNRYSRVPITLAASDALKMLRISGAFRTGDNEAFAQAVASLHGLTVTPRDGGLELASK
jgi:transmembrane sensor